MKDVIRQLNRIAKKEIGTRMTKEQLVYQEELRQKYRNGEIALEEAHRIWRKKYNQESGKNENGKENGS